DMVGFGRPFYVEDDLAERILGSAPSQARCRSSNLCVPAQMLGMKGLCYNPVVNRERRRDAVR
ncbi:MAG: NADH:flavin oxidoreductase, partial [Actinobacteria bacterium]|nr:NADH:flavin oxidoreductase [Actinomycetota bacterium]